MRQQKKHTACCLGRCLALFRPQKDSYIPVSFLRCVWDALSWSCSLPPMTTNLVTSSSEQHWVPLTLTQREGVLYLSE